MIASQIYMKYFKNEDLLFSEVDKILEQNGLYNIDMDNGFFILSYWFGYMFEVKETDYQPILRLGTPYYGHDIRLYWGDIIVLDAVALHQSWFYFPKLLIGQKEKFIVNARGYTKMGNIFSLIRTGILKRIGIPNNDGAFC